MNPIIKNPPTLLDYTKYTLHTFSDTFNFWREIAFLWWHRLVLKRADELGPTNIIAITYEIHTHILFLISMPIVQFPFTFLYQLFLTRLIVSSLWTICLLLRVPKCAIKTPKIWRSHPLITSNAREGYQLTSPTVQLLSFRWMTLTDLSQPDRNFCV